MPLPRFAVWIFSVGTMILGASVASSQSYPNKLIRVVTADPGSANDFVARLIAQGLTASLGQQVIVDNRGGASGAIAAQIVSKAPPDGYTLLFYSNSLWIGPLLRRTTQFDPRRDFSPITLAVTMPNVLVVHPSLPVKSVKDLIALAKARSGDLNYSSGTTGSSNHLAAELFKAMAGVNIVHVPYKSSALAINDLLSGEVQVMFPAAASAVPHVKSGRLRALAVTSAEPSALAPGLSTVAASGLAGYESVLTLGAFAPAGTPAPVINLLNQEIVRFLHTEDTRKRFFNAGAEVVGSSPAGFAAKVKSEMARLGKVIKDAGISAD